MVLALVVFLFRDFGSYSAGIEEQNQDKLIGEFNSQFTKLEGRNDLTAHDVITIANLAKDNNKKYEFNKAARPSANSFYICVDAPSKNNLESATEAEFMNFLKNNSSKTFSISQIGFGSKTKRVNYVKFKLGSQ